MSQPLVCRWGIVGLPGSPEARRFLDEVVVTGSGEGAQAAPIQHHIAALASDGEQGNEASTSAIQEVRQQVVAASPSSSSSSSAASSSSSASPALQPHFVSSPGDLLSHPPTQCLLLCPSAFFSSSSTALFDYATAALSAGKSVLIPRPASLQLSSSQAKALTQLAKEKRAWLGIMVVKRKAATKATKRLTAVQEAATAINGASAHAPSGLTAAAMTPSASSTGSTSSNSLRWAADECARCRERGLAESSMIGWEDNLAMLECLDEMRESGAVLAPTQPPIRSESHSSLPEEATSAQSSQDTAAPLSYPATPKNRILDIGPRQFRKTPVPDSRRVEELKAQEGVAGASEDVQEDSSMSLTSQDESYDSIQSGSAAALQRDILELKHLLRQKDAHIAALMEARGADEGNGVDENGRAAGDVVLPLSKAAGSTKLNSKAAAIRLSMPAQGYGATAAAASRLPRRRGSSVGSFSNSNSEASTPTRATFPTMGTSASINPIEPVSAAGSRSASATSSTPGGRARRDAGTTPPTPSVPLPLGTSSAANAQHAASLDTMLTSSPRVNVNGQSLKEVKEADDEPAPSTPSQQQTGFLAPTRASESRRKIPATPSSIPRHRRSSLSPAPPAAAAAASPRTPSPSPSSSTPPPATPARPPSPDLLVQRLTNDVEQYRSSLDSTRQQLHSTTRHLSSLQRMYDSTKEALASSRVESERRETALLRKEKALSEALERARRAEGEVKELGRSSREWGTRVRVVEAELGEVRRMTAKAEGSYEALRGAWANTRSKWEGEVKGLREELRRTVAEHRQAAREAQRRLEEVEEEWKGREGQRKGLEAVLEALKGEREKARHQVVAEVGRLVQRVAKGEEVRLGHEADVRGVMDELERLKRLMRAGVDEEP